MAQTDKIEIWVLTFSCSFAISTSRAWTYILSTITDVSHTHSLTLASLLDTWNFKASSSLRERCDNFHVTDGHFGQKCNFWHPHQKWFGPKMFAPWNFPKNLIYIIKRRRACCESVCVCVCVSPSAWTFSALKEISRNLGNHWCSQFFLRDLNISKLFFLLIAITIIFRRCTDLWIDKLM